MNIRLLVSCALSKIDEQPKRTRQLLQIMGVVTAVVLLATPWQVLLWYKYVDNKPDENGSATAVDGASTSEANGGQRKPMILKVAPPPASPGSSSASRSRYGIAAGSNLAAMNWTELNSTFDAYVALGVSWVRFDIEWNNIEHEGPGQYNWANYDKLVSAASAHRLNILAVLAYTPPWARAAGCDDAKCPPANPAHYAQFAASATSRYKDKGLSHWEIWNEPNSHTFWAPQADPAGYARLLAATYPAMKAVHPTAHIITGGTAPQATEDGNFAPADFLNAVYAAGAKPFFDAVGHHPYTFPLLPSSTQPHAWRQMAQTPVSLRSIMTRYGDQAKKIWLTEYGAPTGGPGPTATIANRDTVTDTWRVDDALLSEMVKDAVGQYHTFDWAGPFFWYSYKDAGASQSTNENFFGLVRYDNSKKPAYSTFQELIKKQ